MADNDGSRRVAALAQFPTRFIVSVDVESRLARDPQTDIWGRAAESDEEFGIAKIMDILESHGVRGTFFLNPYEMVKHGEQAVAEAAEQIHCRGHDLELHTHPRAMYTFSRMSSAPLDLQREVLERGIGLLETWTGKRPVAHRAGAFAADLNTLIACAQVGLLTDSSLSTGSRISGPLVDVIGPTNVPTRVEGIWEIPVTYYRQLALAPWCSRRILDIEGSSLSEIKQVTCWAIRNKVPTVCLLMHSFSLCRRGVPSAKVTSRLIALLTWLSGQEGIAMNTIEEVCQIFEVGRAPAGRIGAPTTGIRLTWIRVLTSWDDGWKNRVAAAVSIAGLTALLLAVAYLGVVLLSR